VWLKESLVCHIVFIGPFRERLSGVISTGCPARPRGALSSWLYRSKQLVCMSGRSGLPEATKCDKRSSESRVVMMKLHAQRLCVSPRRGMIGGVPPRGHAPDLPQEVQRTSMPDNVLRH